MSRTRKDSTKGGQRDRHISVRGVHRDPPDLHKLSRALIQLAMAQAEAEAEADQAQKDLANGDQAKWPKPEASK
jgi:hypothetical protein